ncbi:hypothetical protein ES703_41255 [subsurface metagenome]
MITDGISARDVNVISFEGDQAQTVAKRVNDWLIIHQGNTIYDITFQRSNMVSAFIVYRQGREPSDDAPVGHTHTH